MSFQRAQDCEHLSKCCDQQNRHLCQTMRANKPSTAWSTWRKRGKERGRQGRVERAFFFAPFELPSLPLLPFPRFVLPQLDKMRFLPAEEERERERRVQTCLCRKTDDDDQMLPSLPPSLLSVLFFCANLQTSFSLVRPEERERERKKTFARSPKRERERRTDLTDSTWPLFN